MSAMMMTYRYCGVNIYRPAFDERLCVLSLVDITLPLDAEQDNDSNKRQV